MFASTTSAFFSIIAAVTQRYQLHAASRRRPGPDSEAADFVADLHRRFDARRRELLAARADARPASTPASAPSSCRRPLDIRTGDWTVPEAPKPLADRRVEITGPVERKMMINALNSGAQVFMADFEDANSPTWDNVIAGQVNLQDAVRGTIEAGHPGQDLPAGRRDRHPGRPPPGLAPAGEALPGRRRAHVGQPVRLRAVRVPQRAGEPVPRLRPRTSTCPSWRATSRPASGTT